MTKEELDKLERYTIRELKKLVPAGDTIAMEALRELNAMLWNAGVR